MEYSIDREKAERGAVEGAALGVCYNRGERKRVRTVGLQKRGAQPLGLVRRHENGFRMPVISTLRKAGSQ